MCLWVQLFTQPCGAGGRKAPTAPSPRPNPWHRWCFPAPVSVENEQTKQNPDWVRARTGEPGTGRDMGGPGFGASTSTSSVAHPSPHPHTPPSLSTSRVLPEHYVTLCIPEVTPVVPVPHSARGMQSIPVLRTSSCLATGSALRAQGSLAPHK